MIKEQNLNQIPKDWRWEKLGAICNIVYGKGLPTKNLTKEGFPVYGANGIIGCYDKYLYESPMVLISCRGAYSGKINLSPPKCYVTNNSLVLNIICVNQLDRKYLFYSLTAANKNKLVTGTAQPQVTINNAVELKIPLPPLPIQHAIVSKIEELFSELDKGIENLRGAQQQLKIYRQSVLKWAFEGRLTNGNLKEGELPEGWKYIKMGDVIEKPKYGTSKKCEYEIKGIGVLRIPNIIKGIIDSADLKFANFDEHEIKTYSLKEGDILTIRSNGSLDIVGKCALITKKDVEFLFAGYLIRLRPLQKLVLPKYLINILSSINLRNQIEGKAKSTSGVNNINSEELAELIISLPPIKEQYKIVQEIERRFSVADKMDESFCQSLQKAEALRQSILKKAFEGQLLI